MEEESSGSQKRWATHQLELLRENGSLMTSYPYPVQIWKLGDQPIMALGGELVVQYAIELKKLFGQETFVMGYANDDMAYIPSEPYLKKEDMKEIHPRRCMGCQANGHRTFRN